MSRAAALAATLAAALLLVPAAALAQAPPGKLFSVKNATKAAVRCMLTEGGPITQLVTIKPSAELTERVGPGATVSLSCPKVRDTAFGPLKPGVRYAFLKVRGRVDLVEVAAAPVP